MAGLGRPGAGALASVRAAQVDAGLVALALLAVLAFIVVLLVIVVSQAVALRRARAATRSRAPTAGARRHPPRAGDIVMICDSHLTATYVSPASVPLLGYRPEELLGTRITAVVHPADAARLQAYVSRPDAPLISARYRRHDGEWVWLDAATGSGLPGQSGAIHFFPREVSDRVRAEQAVAAQRRLTDVVLALASDAFIGSDEQGTIVEWNRAAESMLGWPRAEAIGRDLADTVVPVPLRVPYRKGMRQLWSGEFDRVDEPTEATALRRDGTEITVEVSAWTVQVGESRQMNALMRDVTGRKQVEQALTEAREQAIEASRLKSEFLATMSHEIRTPMNGVIGLAGLMLATDLDPDQRRYSEGIRTAGNALLNVINDILDFSKVESGKIALDDADFDLLVLVEDVVELVAEPARAKGLELVGYCHPELPLALRGDPARLRQVLLNLASNAVKFTEQGEVVVRAEPVEADRLAGEAAPDGNRVWIRFAVIDTGIGIAAQDRDRMFDAFSQADASTTRRFGGTGLGLAICRRLVEAMGGRIGLESELGTGSTFWCEVPLRTQAPGGTAARLRRDDLSGLRVLIVDNNATNRLILSEQLRAWRMSADAVDSGQTALAALRAATERGRPYDVALLDLAMPTMDGLELGRQIADDPGVAAVHLVLLTSGLPVDADAAAQAGIAASLTKPVHQSELYDCLARIMTTHEPTPVPAAAAPLGAAPPDGATPARGRVLLAEDNSINQQVAAAMLQKLGYAVDLATDGFGAVDLFDRQPYDAVLMDCQMPGMDGFDATRELRRREGGQRHTTIIALTASALAEDRDRCLAAGMDDYLSKPIMPDGLAAVLDRWRDGGPPGPEVGAAIETRLDEIRTVDPDAAGALIRQLVASFADRLPDSVGAIVEAVDHRDAGGAADHAHSLQGSAANLGANALAATCQDLTGACRAGDLDRAVGLLPHLHRDEQSVLAALRALQPRL